MFIKGKQLDNDASGGCLDLTSQHPSGGLGLGGKAVRLDF